MKRFLELIVLTAVLVSSGIAGAASLEIDAGRLNNGWNVVGRSDLALSRDMLDLLDLQDVAVSNEGAAVMTAYKQLSGEYVQVYSSAPLTHLTLDDGNGAVSATASSGGFYMMAPAMFGDQLTQVAANGGFLRLTDINVDLSSKQVFANLMGGNGVGELRGIHMWNFTETSSPLVLFGRGTFVSSLSGLSLTTQGRDLLTRSLGLLDMGSAALAQVKDFGTLTLTVSVVALPESSTGILMGLGLICVGLAAARGHHMTAPRQVEGL